MDQIITEQMLIEQINESVDGAVQEVVSMANDEWDDPHAHAFLHDIAQVEYQKAVRDYIFELLKAFGCCAHSVPTDVHDSKARLKKLEHQYPGLLWCKSFYRAGVSLSDVNDDLAHHPQKLLHADFRLDDWLE